MCTESFFYDSVFLVRPLEPCCTTCSHFPFRYALPIPPTTVQPHHRLQPTDTPSHRRELTHKLLPSRQPFLQPVGDLLAVWAKRVLGISPVIFATYIRCLVFERRAAAALVARSSHIAKVGQVTIEGTSPRPAPLFFSFVHFEYSSAIPTWTIDANPLVVAGVVSPPTTPASAEVLARTSRLSTGPLVFGTCLPFLHISSLYLFHI